MRTDLSREFAVITGAAPRNFGEGQSSYPIAVCPDIVWEESSGMMRNPTANCRIYQDPSFLVSYGG